MKEKKLKMEFIKNTAENRLYNINIPIIGLTGGVATGKSTVSKIFRDQGYPLICADELVHQIYEKEESLKFIQSKWPSAIRNEKVDFKVLREIFFGQKEAKIQIEEFIYSHLKEEFLQALKKLGATPYVIYDVPLLFEKNLNDSMDLIIVVYCPKDEQVKRLKDRDQIEEELAQSILKSQIDIETKRNKSDMVIDNSGPKSKILQNFNKLSNSIFRE
jgi:dephospho-CoA kinase